MVVNLGWADMDLDVPPSCLVTQPSLPNYHLPGQSWADSGTIRILDNPTHVHDHHQAHPEFLIPTTNKLASNSSTDISKREFH